MCGAMTPSPKSLILDLLATLPRADGSSMAVRALVEAGAIFGLAENSMRVALARLLAHGRIERDERGRYRQGDGVAAMSGEIRSWRRLGERVVAWNGGWIAVHEGTSARGAVRARSGQALRLLGFRSLTPGLHIRPDNLADEIDSVRNRLSGLGLATGSLVARLSDLDHATDARARTLWQWKTLADAQQAGCREIAESRTRLESAMIEDAMAETFLVGGRMIRLLVLDPLLPPEIAPTSARDELVGQMVAYDDFGRACWAAFMKRHNAPHRRTPVDLRVAEGADQLDRVAGRMRTR